MTGPSVTDYRPHEPERRNFKNDETYLMARNRYLELLEQYEKQKEFEEAITLTIGTAICFVGVFCVLGLLLEIIKEFGFWIVGGVVLTIISIFLFHYKRSGKD